MTLYEVFTEITDTFSDPVLFSLVGLAAPDATSPEISSSGLDRQLEITGLGVSITKGFEPLHKENVAHESIQSSPQDDTGGIFCRV